jgi:hypothetical protein
MNIHDTDLTRSYLKAADLANDLNRRILTDDSVSELDCQSANAEAERLQGAMKAAGLE